MTLAGIYTIFNQLEMSINEKSTEKSVLFLVAGTGLEPVTFGL